MNNSLSIRKFIGWIGRNLYLQYSVCYRCERPWNICKEHATRYEETSACFPLCEDCWQELTPQERLPYYKQLYVSWRVTGEETYRGSTWNEFWNKLEKAVLEGK